MSRKKIQNPILRGFNPDPSICRVGDDYYLAVSTFEWYPGAQIYHSSDLENWHLTGGVDHAFKPGTVLPAGGSFFVTPDVTAFRLRTEGPSGAARPPHISSCPASSTAARGVAPIRVVATPASTFVSRHPRRPAAGPNAVARPEPAPGRRRPRAAAAVQADRADRVAAAKPPQVGTPAVAPPDAPQDLEIASGPYQWNVRLAGGHQVAGEPATRCRRHAHGSITASRTTATRARFNDAFWLAGSTRSADL